MKKITLFLFTLLVISCSRIRFYSGEESDFPFTKEDIALQKEVIAAQDPIFDSRMAHLFFNNRFIGIMNVGLYLPGVNMSLLEPRELFKSRAIWGLTDFAPDHELEILACTYAYLYNCNILKLTKRENLFQELEPYQKSLIYNN